MTDSANVTGDLVYESTRARLANTGQTKNLTRSEEKAISDSHGNQAEFLANIYSSLSGVSTQGSSSQSSWNASNTNSSSVTAGTAFMKSIDNSKLKARQVGNVELDYINFTASENYAAEKGISQEQAKKELIRGAALAADTDWEEAYETYTEEEIEAYKEANEYLANTASTEGVTFTNEEGEQQAAFTSTEEQRDDHDMFLNEAFNNDDYVNNVGIDDSEKSAWQITKKMANLSAGSIVGSTTGLLKGAVGDTIDSVKVLTDVDTYVKGYEGAEKALALYNEDPEKFKEVMIAAGIKGFEDAAEGALTYKNQISLLSTQGQDYTFADKVNDTLVHEGVGFVNPAKKLKLLEVFADVGKVLDKLPTGVKKVVDKATPDNGSKSVTREAIQQELDKLPDDIKDNYTVRELSDGSFTTVRKDTGVSEQIKVTADGNLVSPIKSQSDSVGATNQAKGQASEDYVAEQLGDEFKSQQAYINGNPVDGRPAGSVVPDFCSLDGSCSVEVKNYDLSRTGGESSLVKNISEQAIQRETNLPPEMTQTVKIDIRGQDVSATQQQNIIDRIVDKSNGIIDADSIEFIEDND